MSKQVFIIIIILIVFLFGCTNQTDISKEEAEKIAKDFVLSIPSDAKTDITPINTNQHGNDWKVTLKVVSVSGFITDQQQLEITIDSESRAVECVKNPYAELCGDELIAEVGICNSNADCRMHQGCLCGCYHNDKIDRRTIEVGDHCTCDADINTKNCGCVNGFCQL